MIRFIDLTNQIMIPYDDNEIYREFAFFNTVNDRFCQFDGEQTWHTLKDFVEYFITDKNNPYYDELYRFINLLPRGYFDADNSDTFG